MAQNTLNRTRIMRMSWQLQKNGTSTRSKALIAAWAFFRNEKILINYLTRDLNRGREIQPRALNQFSLFGA